MIRSVSVRAVPRRKKRSGRPMAILGSVVVFGVVGVMLWQMMAAAPSDDIAKSITSPQNMTEVAASASSLPMNPAQELVAQPVADQPLQPQHGSALSLQQSNSEATTQTPPAPAQAPNSAPSQERRSILLAADSVQANSAQADRARADRARADRARADRARADRARADRARAESTPPTVSDAQSQTLQAGTSDNTAITAATQLIADGHWLEARRRLSKLLNQELTSVEHNEVRALLHKVADETIFSKRVLEEDALVTTYTIESGDRLAKIAPRFNVPYEIIMRINGIKSANRIRAGQRIKVPRGPFHVRIDASDYRLDLYLQETYLRSYRVALGRGKGTPLGQWKVTECLKNPRFYPPESSEIRHVIAGGDPENPLGTRWIGLEGTSGDAVGQEGFGIHGTNEPDTIGQPVSLGCVRLRNDDVEFIYTMLRPGKSVVTTEP